MATATTSFEENTKEDLWEALKTIKRVAEANEDDWCNCWINKHTPLLQFLDMHLQRGYHEN